MSIQSVTVYLGATHQRHYNQPVIDAKRLFGEPPGEDTQYEGDSWKDGQDNYRCKNLRSTVVGEPWCCFGANTLGRRKSFWVKGHISTGYLAQRETVRQIVVSWPQMDMSDQ